MRETKTIRTSRRQPAPRGPLTARLLLVHGGPRDDENAWTDLVFVSAKIFTSDQSPPWMEAFAVKDGTFSYVADFAGAETVIIDADGKMVVPGLADTHRHSPGTF